MSVKLNIDEIIQKVNEAKPGFAIQDIELTKSDLEELERSLPNKLVFYTDWNKLLSIRDAFSRKYVLQNLDLFLKCFIEFDVLAHELMKLLKAKVDIRNIKERNRTGVINNEWEYMFHGYHCRFFNNKSKQTIEVNYTFGREYGDVDDYFLFEFIKSTCSLSKQFKLLNSEATILFAREFKLLNGEVTNLRKVTSVLKQEGYLITIGDDIFKGLILNRSKI